MSMGKNRNLCTLLVLMNYFDFPVLLIDSLIPFVIQIIKTKFEVLEPIFMSLVALFVKI